jgi:hypothetical protein
VCQSDFLIIGQLSPQMLHVIALRRQGHFHTEFLVFVRIGFICEISIHFP